MTNTATPKQIEFINSLKTSRDLEDFATALALDLSRQLWKRGEFTKEAASATIDALKAAPRKTAEPERPEPEAGVYRDGDRLFRVYLGQNSGKMLVQEIKGDTGTIDYTYLGLAVKHLPASATRLGLEEVGALGKTFDHCLVCGRRLDVPESVDRGIGPVCAAKYV
jgi:hypothetical protein